jgi:predicted phosphodiesterase
VVVLGHSHIPFAKDVNRLQIISPGSCGQPRDYKPGACYAVLETENRKVMLYRESYDIQRLVKILVDRKFPLALIHILTRENNS